ncbi:MAG: response regulator transcription factor [Bacteroidia bacterium]|nr:response regulator transcription factor [Bacteroidia bacterium]
MKDGVLLVSKDMKPARELAEHLRSSGFRTEVVADGLLALDVAESFHPQHAIIDLSIGSDASLELAEMIRNLRGSSNVRISFLLNEVDEHSKSERFGYLADEYFIKPGNPEHIAVKLRRSFTGQHRQPTTPRHFMKDGPIRYNDLIINRDAFTVHLGSEEISLSRKEFELLELLCQNPDKVYTRSEIYRRIWKREEQEGVDRTLDVHIRRLRKKTGNRLIKTVKGVGYRLAVNA